MPGTEPGRQGNGGLPPAPGERVVDLHAHTTASDGSHTPAELAALAVQAGLKVLAVTDHDTTEGVAEAVEAGRQMDLEIIPGIELSAEPPDFELPSGVRSQCHILGLYIDPASPPLLDRLQQVIHNRNTRNARIIEKMQQQEHWDITLEEVEAAAGGNVIARPHFARVMIDKKLVGSMQEAFDVYLGKGGKVYVERDRLTADEAFQLIHQAGGVAILAHPNNLGLDPASTEDAVKSLQAAGLDGIEARYNLHTLEDTRRYLALAAKLGLVTSGGSDFHGLPVKPSVFLGHVEAGEPAPYSLLADLQAARAS